MADSDPGSAAITAGVGALSTIIAGILNNYATDKTNQQNLEIYNQQRQDQLAASKQTQTNWNTTNTENQQQNAFNNQQTNYQNAVKKEQTGFDRQQQAYQNATNGLTVQNTLTKSRTAPFIKGS